MATISLEKTIAKDKWLKFCTKVAVTACICGVILSIYAYSVSSSLENDPNYQPYCNVSPLFSCSIVFKSEYAHGFGFMGDFLGNNSMLNVRNSTVGIVFYSIMFVLSWLKVQWVISTAIWLNLLACASSLYFGYLLMFVIKHLCIVCIATYFANTTILVAMYAKKRRIMDITDHIEMLQKNQ